MVLCDVKMSWKSHSSVGRRREWPLEPRAVGGQRAPPVPGQHLSGAGDGGRWQRGTSHPWDAGFGTRGARSALPLPSRSGHHVQGAGDPKEHLWGRCGGRYQQPPRLSSYPAPYHLRKSYFKAALMKPLIFAEPGSLPSNPGRAGVQVPRCRGLDAPCPLWEPSLSAASLSGPFAREY